MALWWREEAEVNILNYSKFHIDAHMEDPINSRLTLFYGSPSVHMIRNHSWDLLRKLTALHTIHWLIFDDFNEVCFSWEVNSKRIRGEWQMKKFREVIEENNLFDLGYQGYPFTYTNKRMAPWETKTRLDRALVSADWLNKFPTARVSHVATSTFDHFLLVIYVSPSYNASMKKSFKFEPMWVRCTDFRN